MIFDSSFSLQQKYCTVLSLGDKKCFTSHTRLEVSNSEEKSEAVVDFCSFFSPEGEFDILE